MSLLKRLLFLKVANTVNVPKTKRSCWSYNLLLTGFHTNPTATENIKEPVVYCIIEADPIFQHPKLQNCAETSMLSRSGYINHFSQLRWIVQCRHGRGLHSSNTCTSFRYLSNQSGSKKDDDSTGQEMTENIMTVPNLLCASRVVLAPVIGCYVISGEFSFAFGLLAVASFTDLLDGYIARQFKSQSSVFGSMLDPLADKVLMTVMVISLTYASLLPFPLCALIIGRDIAIVSAVSYLRFISLPQPRTLSRYFDLSLPTVEMKPTLISKYNTFFQVGLVGLSLAAPVFNFVDSPLLHCSWYFVATTTVLSGLSYVVRNKATFRILGGGKK